MNFGVENIIDLAMNIDKLNLATLVGEVMDKIVEFQIFFYLQKIYQKVKSMVFGFENIMDFLMEIDKLNLANLVGKVMMDKIMEYQIFLPRCTEVMM